MDEESKKKFDSLAILWKGAWDNFHERTKYDWKFCLAFWTVFVGLIYILIHEDITLKKEYIPLWPLWVWALFIGLVSTLVHICWICGIKRADNLDRLIAIHYEEKMQDISNSRFDEKLQKKIDEVRRKWDEDRFCYSHKLQIGITCMLYLSAIIISLAI